MLNMWYCYRVPSGRMYVKRFYDSARMMAQIEKTNAIGFNGPYSAYGYYQAILIAESLC